MFSTPDLARVAVEFVLSAALVIGVLGLGFLVFRVFR
jgi:hypothetical protein